MMRMPIKGDRLRCLLIVFLLLISNELKAEWKTLAPGFDYHLLENSRAHFFRIDPKKFRIDLLFAADYETAALTAKRYRERSGASLVINGGFFDEALRPLGLLQRGGSTSNPVRNVPWGIFLLGGNDGRTPSMIPRNDWRPDNVRMAIQAGPRLIVKGKILTFKENVPTRRSAVGITPEGSVVIAVSEGLFTLSEWAEALQKVCVDALNLDGGGSSHISVNLPNFPLEVIGATGVPNALAVFPSY